jgi:HlyD family secretion protein
VKTIFVSEGQRVRKGAPLLQIDDTVQRATVEQQASQVSAGMSLLEELRAQPRKENVDVAQSQIDAARASVKTAQDELLKQQTANELNPKSISRDALDSAVNAAAVARANLDVAQKQVDRCAETGWPRRSLVPSESLFQKTNSPRRRRSSERHLSLWRGPEAIRSEYELSNARRR